MDCILTWHYIGVCRDVVVCQFTPSRVGEMTLASPGAVSLISHPCVLFLPCFTGGGKLSYVQTRKSPCLCASFGIIYMPVGVPLVMDWFKRPSSAPDRRTPCLQYLLEDRIHPSPTILGFRRLLGLLPLPHDIPNCS